MHGKRRKKGERSGRYRVKPKSGMRMRCSWVLLLGGWHREKLMMTLLCGFAGAWRVTAWRMQNTWKYQPQQTDYPDLQL